MSTTAIRKLNDPNLNWILTNWSQVGDLRECPNRLVQNLDEFLNNPLNRDGRGLKSSSHKTVLRTLKHIKSAVTKVTSDDVEPAVRKSTKIFLKRLAHDKSFKQTITGGRRFWGYVNQAGRKREEKKLRCNSAQFVFEQGWKVKRVESISELKHIGRKLNLCVANKNTVTSDYFDALRTEMSEFWLLIHHDHDIALFDIKINNQNRERTIGEFCMNNEDEEDLDWDIDEDEEDCLPREVAIKMLNCLESSADDINEFVQIGAFAYFATRGVEESEPNLSLSTHRLTYNIWIDGSQIIFETKPKVGDDEKREQNTSSSWTLIKRNQEHDSSDGYCATEYFWEPSEGSVMCTEQMLDLFLRYPSIGEIWRDKNRQCNRLLMEDSVQDW